MSETTLWTNSAPTNDFSAQTVTLSDSIQNYKAIRIYYRISKTVSDTYYVDFPKELVLNSLNANDKPNMVIAAINSNLTYIRIIRYDSNTTYEIKDAYRINASGTQNAAVIPTKICGLK